MLLILPLVLIAAGVWALAGPRNAAGQGQGGGHTPVTLCHWVPAHGGSYILITPDDDGSSGNANLQAHMGHENDIIPAPAGTCPSNTATTPRPTRTHAAVTRSPEATKTRVARTATVTRTAGVTRTAVVTRTARATGTVAADTATPQVPTATQTAVPTATSTQPAETSTSTPVATATDTAVAATNTPIATNTPLATNTTAAATNTPIATNTPVIGVTGGNTPAATNTAAPESAAPASPTPVQVLGITVPPPAQDDRQVSGLPAAGSGDEERRSMGLVLIVLGLTGAVMVGASWWRTGHQD